MPGSIYKPIGLPRQPLVHPRTRLALTNDGRGSFALKSFRGGESVAGGRRRCDTDLHGGARYHYRGVALRYIAGGLSATVYDGEWVLTSYLAANAIILPITGWLSAHLGRRNYFLMSIAVFTLSSG